MADEKDPLPAPVVDVRAEIALLRATAAPVVFFEASGSYGFRNGVANITLMGGLHVPLGQGVLTEGQAMAHLRFPLAAIPSLREALDAIELLAQPVASDEKQ